MSSKPDTARVFGEDIHIPGLDGWVSSIAANGYTLIPDWLTSKRVRKLGEDLRREVNPIRELMPPDFTTVRAHNLLAKTRCVDDLVCDPRLVALVHGVLGPYIQISVVAMFDLLPGAKAQGLHQDDGLWPIPRPHPPFVVNAVIAVDEFTKENGATQLVPKSHLWHDQTVKQPPEVTPIQVEMKPGTMLIWTGALWHGGGANNTNESRLAIDINFNLSYLAQQENQYVGVPRSEVEKMPERLQRLIGYKFGLNHVGPGMVDLRDPLRMRDRVSYQYDVNADDVPNIGSLT
ncbi:MAG: phytanoyl-CoA dioxygenase family protein [Gammaproteobacteria bacterium]|nr:phytanoyl-CoA dioxygenase family protein [Gammaproteobacteria bacterium]